MLLLFEADEETGRLAIEMKKRHPSMKVVQSASLSSSIGSLVAVDEGLSGSPSVILGQLKDALIEMGEGISPDDSWCETLLAEKKVLEAEIMSSFDGRSLLSGLLLP